MIKKPINIKEIAQLAKVSPATVSRVINKRGRFSKETEKRILEIIDEYQFVPNKSAQSLRTNKSSIIGIVVPDIMNLHFANLVLKMEMLFFDYGYSCLICNTNESNELERKHIQSLTAQNVSGIILISGQRGYPELDGVPVVYLDRPPNSSHSKSVLIESDNLEGGYIATKEILNQGAKKPICLFFDGGDLNQKRRREGFFKALKEQKIKTTDSLTIGLEQSSFAAAFRAVNKLVDEKYDFDAIMCTTDAIAAGSVVALQKRGILVPKDVLITGYDDTLLAETSSTGITSVYQDVPEMARIGVEMMIKMQKGEALTKLEYELPVSLTIRKSTRRD